MFEAAWSVLEGTGYPWTILIISVFCVILIFISIICRHYKTRDRIIITNQATGQVEDEISYGRIVKISDGDTIRVIDKRYDESRIKGIETMQDFRDFKKGSFSVRLYAVDTPEKAHLGSPGQKYGEIARTRLVEACIDKGLTKSVKKKVKEDVEIYKECKLITLDVDRYGRSLCVVKVGNLDLSMYMISEGLATVYYGSNARYDGKRRKFESEMEYAQSNKKGMWKENIELPDEYKRRMKKW